MIAYIEGKVKEKTAESLVVMVGGFGLEIRAPAATMEKAPGRGGDISLHTFLQLREDTLQLYGFDSARSRGLFIKLMSVSGFGAAKALSVLSIFSPEGFEDVVRRGDVDSLTMIPGIGKKSAQRLLLEMRGKIEIEIEEVSGLTDESKQAFLEAVQAMVQLGFGRSEAQKVLKECPAEDREAGVERMLQFALKNINR